MKSIKQLTVFFILIGLFHSVVIVLQTSGRVKLLITFPYIVMLGLSLPLFKKESKPSLVGYFIAVSLVCILLIGVYNKAAFHSGSSPDALVFVIAPIFSLFILIVLYIVCTWLVGVLFFHHNDRTLLIIGGIIIAVIVVFNWRPSFFEPSSPPGLNRKNEVSFTYGDLVKSKKLGVFVKELHYRVDGFTGPVNFTPYIERAFRYLDVDSTRVELLRNSVTRSFDLYSVQFQRMAVDDAYIETRNYHECAFFPCLTRPELDDTLIYNIKRRGQAIGTIKVWD